MLCIFHYGFLTPNMCSYGLCVFLFGAVAWHCYTMIKASNSKRKTAHFSFLSTPEGPSLALLRFVVLSCTNFCSRVHSAASNVSLTSPSKNQSGRGAASGFNYTSTQLQRERGWAETDERADFKRDGLEAKIEMIRENKRYPVPLPPQILKYYSAAFNVISSQP